MYVIKNIKTNSYFQKRVNKYQLHFVLDIKLAKHFKEYNKCEEVINEFKNKKNYTIMEYNL